MPSSRDRQDKGKSAASAGPDADFLIEVNGWTLYFHPLFLDQFERVIEAAELEQATRSIVGAGANTKLAAAIRALVLVEIPQDPTRAKYRHGGTLGKAYRHWMRAKFGNGRFRLFFRFRKDAKVIVYTWVNDENSLRTYGSRSDAYVVFRAMLESEDPPDSWDALLLKVSDLPVKKRAARLKKREDIPG